MTIFKPFLTLVFLTYLGHAEGQVVFDTMNGPVSGESISVNGKNIDVFLSIPFAKPPVGDLRFKPPQPAVPWQGVLDATSPSSACVQPTNSITLQFPVFAGNYSEDCLYLNIWKPSHATSDSNLPVMLWIYGGAFNYGMKDIPNYNGQYLSGEYDVIFVSINYRIGLFGFGYLGPDTLPGNLGLLDQLEAMKWVRNNIGNFGGDPDKVTIFGESAGSWSVGLHLVSPLSKDYFKNAIMQSGAPVSKVLEGVVYPHKKSRENVRQLTSALKCPGHTDSEMYRCLMDARTEELVTGINEVTLKGIDFYPVVDDHFLEDQPVSLMERGVYNNANVMMGVTKDEHMLFVTFLYALGETYSFEDIDVMLGKVFLTGGFADENKIKALKLFYGSQMPNPEDNVRQVFGAMTSDLIFACPTHLYGSALSSNPMNEVYFYILNYRESQSPFPPWTGVPHTSDLALIFGMPLNLSSNYNDVDRQMSRLMMTYWTNFAKSGSPNSPLSVTANWPTFDSEDQQYMALDSDSNLAIRQGPRGHECAFVNNILPKIPSKDNGTTYPPSCEWPTSSSRNIRQDVSVVTATLLLALAIL